jgi:unsaturated rhamnogalacturonyl hydrolase
VRRSALLIVLLSGCGEDPRPVCDAAQIDRVSGVADWVIDEFPADYGWGWRGGLMIAGLTTAYECTGRRRDFDVAEQWMQAEMEVAFDPRHVNDAVGGLALLDAHAVTSDPVYLDAAQSLADFLVERYPDVEGAYLHADDQLWVDTTFMAAPFLAKFGHVTGDERYFDAAVTQILAHAERMQDPDTGLWWHGWDYGDFESGGDPHHGVFWGRGNGWAAASTAQVLLRLPPAHARRAAVEDVLARHIAGAASVQAESGGWHTIVDDPTTYLETSGTIMLSTGARVATRLGLGDFAEVYARGEQYLESQLAADGRLDGVAGPTSLSDDRTEYSERPIDEAPYFAQALYIMLLSLPR